MNGSATAVIVDGIRNGHGIVSDVILDTEIEKTEIDDVEISVTQVTNTKHSDGFYVNESPSSIPLKTMDGI